MNQFQRVTAPLEPSTGWMGIVQAFLLAIPLLLALAISASAFERVPSWTHDLGAPTRSAPSVYEGKVYIGNDAGKLSRLDLATGAQDWSYDCRPLMPPKDTTVLCLATRPAVYGDAPGSERIYVTATNGYVLAFTLAGQKLWCQHPTKDENGTPAYWKGKVYFGNSGQVHRLNADTGLIDATSPNIGEQLDSCVSMPGDDLVWVGSDDGSVYLLNNALTTVVAAYDTGSKSCKSSPYVNLRPGPGMGRLYIGSSNNNFLCVNAIGLSQVYWTRQVGGEIESSPWLDGASGKVVVGCSDGKVYAWDSITGADAGTYQTAGPLKSSPVVINGIIYIGGSDHSIYAIRLSDMSLQWTASTGGAVTGPCVGSMNGHQYLVVGSEDGKVYGFELD